MSSSVWGQFPQLKQIPKEKFPNHLLIIPDGNVRWAEKLKSPSIVGHTKGYRVLEAVLRKLKDLPINIVTIWGFAADNWKRPKEEIDGLMKLFEIGFKKNYPELLKNKSRFIHLGRKDRIPLSLKKTIEKVEKTTKEYKSKIFCLAIDFGGEDQELRIMKAIQKLPKNTEITPDLVKKLRDGKGIIPPADFIIRTSGEQRTSDLGWLEINSEFYSIPKLLPEANLEDFVKAIIDYSKRQRRFGGRSSSIKVKSASPTINDLQKFKEKFDPYLKEYLEKKIKSVSNYTKDPSVLDYINYAKKIILAGGKRARPFLAYLMYNALGGKETEKALRLLVSIELFHSFGLIHDDIIDRANLRHGVETAHLYIKNRLREQNRIGDIDHLGNSQAILLGDGLFAWSQEIINLNTDFDQKTLQNVRKHFHEMADEVGTGQMIDVDVATRKSVPKELIDEKIRLKTAGYSFVKPLQIGADLSGNTDKDIENFCEEFGLKMGIAFQTQDDLLDITSTDEQLQKTTSSDNSQHQHTYFTYFKSLDEGRKIIDKNFNDAKNLVKKSKIRKDSKKKFIDLIELIENRSF